MPEFSSVTGKGFICKCKKNGKVADRDLLTFARNRFLKKPFFYAMPVISFLFSSVSGSSVFALPLRSNSFLVSPL